MSTAIRTFQGKFGRVALLDMDAPLVTHAHSQCHVLLTAGGADTFFAVLPPIHDHRIRRAVSLMRSNVGAELDIDRLAREACLSRAHFFKLFQQCTELTPHVYANMLRMESAMQSLAKTNQSLRSISERLGFSAQSHFTRFFQQHLGIVPSQYRRVVNGVRDGGRVVALR
jgi:transcriptional regulator GlxA family with amidase domain